MRLVLRRFFVQSLLAFLCFARPCAAQDLEFCYGNNYPFKVRSLQIQLSGGENLPKSFRVEVGGLDGGVEEVEVTQVEEQRRWVGKTDSGFKLREIGLRLRIPGFKSSGPEGCEYEVFEATACSAVYRFTTDHIQVAFRAFPVGEPLRLRGRSDVGPVPVEEGCLPDHRQVSGSSSGGRLAERVRRALYAESQFAAYSLDVVAHEGVIYLSGLVRNKTSILRAEKIALGISGVSSVQNDLLVDDSFDGTALVGINDRTVTLEQFSGDRILFSVNVFIEREFFESGHWTVERAKIEEALDRKRVQMQEGYGNKGRVASILLDDEDLGSLEGIEIRRYTW